MDINDLLELTQEDVENLNLDLVTKEDLQGLAARLLEQIEDLEESLEEVSGALEQCQGDHSPVVDYP